MRIMQIVSGTAVNGAVVNCLEISRALRERGHAVHVVCRPNSWASHQLRQEVGLRVIECDLKRRHDRLSAMAWMIRQRQIDVVHTHMSSANFFGILLRRMYRIPCVVATAHNRNLQLHWMFNDRVIAVSDATRRYHVRVNRVPTRRVDVVHNFVDAERFQSVTRADADSVRADLAISPQAKLIGVIGDIGRRKGQIFLVRAMPRILRAVPEAHLLCVGHWRQGYRDQFQQEAVSLGIDQHVTWSEARQDIPSVLKTLDLAALPSLEENLPLTILEAMACGQPVVATNVGGVPECVDHGVTGLLVPPGDSTKLADAIVRILQDRDLANQMGAAGHCRVLQEFSMRSQIERIEAVLEKAAKRPTSSRPPARQSRRSAG